MHAYTDADGLVLATAQVDIPLADVQVIHPTVMTHLDEAPEQVRHLAQPFTHHRLKDGMTGYLLSDYEEIPSAPTGEQICEMAIVHDFVPNTRDHQHYNAINYTTGLDRRLLCERTFDLGDLVRTVYYAEIDEDGNLSVPVVEERSVYTYDALGFHQRRDTDIQWYDRSGQLIDGAIKHTVKRYVGIAALQASRRRRANVRDGMQSTVLGMMLATVSGDPADILETGRAFLVSHDDAMERWVSTDNGGSVRDETTGHWSPLYPDADPKTVHNDVAEDSSEWLDNVVNAVGPGTTIRDYMLRELS